MSNPYAAYLVLITIYDKDGNLEENVEVKIKSSIDTSVKLYSNSSGQIVYDLSNIGYVFGEVITISSIDKYNNQYSSDTFTVNNLGSSTVTINLFLRENLPSNNSRKPQAGITPVTMMNIGLEPVSDNNPFPIKTVNSYGNEVSNNLLQGYVSAEIDNNNADGNQYLGYVDVDGNWYIQQRSPLAGTEQTIKFTNGSSDFSTNWGNRASLTYQYFNEVTW